LWTSCRPRLRSRWASAWTLSSRSTWRPRVGIPEPALSFTALGSYLRLNPAGGAARPPRSGS
jgi:hypothetical protein